MRVTADGLRVLGRSRKPRLFDACASGQRVRDGAKLTLWAVDLPGRTTFATGRWVDAKRKGRYTAVNSATSLQEALAVADLLGSS